MRYNDLSAPTKPWSLDFVAEPEEVAGLRRVMRLHLDLWGMPEAIDAAQLCVTELVTNVITHVGVGTPTTLTVSRNGDRVRIEIQDPDTRALPTLLQPGADSEGGRGMALVDAIATRWGVELREDRKVTWREVAAGSAGPLSTRDTSRLARAEGLLDRYQADAAPGRTVVGSRRLSMVRAEEAAMGIIADLLHWLQDNGHDADDFLDRAQMHFEAGIRTSA